MEGRHYPTRAQISLTFFRTNRWKMMIGKNDLKCTTSSATRLRFFPFFRLCLAIFSFTKNPPGTMHKCKPFVLWSIYELFDHKNGGDHIRRRQIYWQNTSFPLLRGPFLKIFADLTPNFPWAGSPKWCTYVSSIWRNIHHFGKGREKLLPCLTTEVKWD